MDVDFRLWYNDTKVKQWSTAAIARGSRSHTDRWRHDDVYRRQCRENRIPQWLLYYDGSSTTPARTRPLMGVASGGS